MYKLVILINGNIQNVIIINNSIYSYYKIFLLINTSISFNVAKKCFFFIEKFLYYAEIEVFL